MKNFVQSLEINFSRKSILVVGVIGLTVFFALQFSSTRTALIDSSQSFFADEIRRHTWEAFLLRASYYILFTSIAFLLLAGLPRTADWIMDYLVNKRSSTLSTLEGNILSVKGVITFVIFIFLCLTLAVTCDLNALADYSPDSWTYFELAKTVFGSDFYKFNTYRSYFSESYSASFPPGYPFLLALSHLAFGENPLNAAVINIIVTLLIWIVVIRLTSKLGVSQLAAVMLATSLVLWPFYLDEVFSGRAIPAALLLFLLGFNAYSSGTLFRSGLWFGFSALIRFDYLVYAIFSQIAIGLLDSRHRRKLILMPVGFLTGLSPWVIYSLSHFGKVWVSDNSWIAMSAFPAFVLDFPAASTVTVLDNPKMWILRVSDNILPLAHSLRLSAIKFPALIFLGVFFILCLPRFIGSVRWKLMLVIALICASLLPYLLTGYFDNRYFAAVFLCTAIVLMRSIETTLGNRLQWKVYLVGLVATLMISLFAGVLYLAKKSWHGIDRLDNPDPMAHYLEQIKVCQEKTPKTVYVFADHMLAARYGAITGYRAAMLPSNFSRMTEEEKGKYWSYMSPAVMIGSAPKLNGCPVLVK